MEWLTSSVFSSRFCDCSLSLFHFLLSQTFGILLPLLFLLLQILYLLLSLMFGYSCCLLILSPLQYTCLMLMTFRLVEIMKESKNLISMLVGEDLLHERCKGEWPRCVLGVNSLEPPFLYGAGHLVTATCVQMPIWGEKINK